MWISLKILILLWAVNFAPPLLAHFLDEKWSRPLDRGRCFKDGAPLLGPHKTERGVVGGIAMGTVGGMILGFPWWVGFLAGTFSMAGDLLSSFIKRRLNHPSGSVAPGLDQIFEGLFPFAVLGPYCSLSLIQIVFLVFLFSVGAYGGSLFLKKTLLMKPFETYSRPLRIRTRLREWRACQIADKPFHSLFNFERAFYYRVLMKTSFRLMKLYDKGLDNALQLQLRNMTLSFQDLPPAFDGYTILFLSDLHLDGLEGLTERLIEIVKVLPVDLCILGGDYRMEVSGPFAEALSRLRKLVREIRAKDGIYAVLGNHDCLEMVEPLRESGIRVLLNEAKWVERNGERLWIVGVDDPHYYESHDLKEAFEGVPQEAFTLFVAHSPEAYREAARYRSRLYLCGHTHAGQIHIPRIGPLFTHSKTSRCLCRGSWEHQDMQGYTTSGVGASGIPIRFGCPGEAVHITLKRSVQKI